MRWQFWYAWIIIGLTAMVMQNHPADLLYAIPINLLIWYLPTWLVVATVRYFRRPLVVAKPSPKLEDNEPDDGVLPNMTRK